MAIIRKRRDIITENLENELKHNRRNLKQIINRTKREKWKELCKELEDDIWRQEFQIAMKSLKANQIPYPKIRKKITEALFPTTDDTRTIRGKVEETDITPLTREELRLAEKRIKNWKAPGMDGVPS